MDLDLSGLNWITVLDLSLVAYLVYQVLANIRDTRAAQIAIGLVLVVFLFQAAEYLGLETLSYLLGTVLPYLTFALIVIFQTEIRSTLARFGGHRLLSKLVRWNRRHSAVEDSVAEAVVALAASRTGALIVIERKMGLSDYAETGVHVDANLSFELLVSMFSPQGLLHDGAVILRDGRIASAGCYLPLTKRQDLGREFGTRHRAAIGLTEETDAIALVVSSEGQISVCVDGVLRRGLEEPDLRDSLQRELNDQTRR